LTNLHPQEYTKKGAWSCCAPTEKKHFRCASISNLW